MDKKLNLNQSIINLSNGPNKSKNKNYTVFPHLTSKNLATCSYQTKTKKIIKQKESNYEKLIPKKKLTERRNLIKSNVLKNINSFSNLLIEKNKENNISETIIYKEDNRNISSRNIKHPLLVNCIYGKSTINYNKDSLNQTKKTIIGNDNNLCSLIDYQESKFNDEKLPKKKKLLSNDIINKTMMNKKIINNIINDKSNINNNINNTINNFEEIKIISVKELSNSIENQQNNKNINNIGKSNICNTIYQKVPKFRKISRTGKTITHCLSSRRNLINNIINNDKNDNHLMVNYNIIDIKNNINNINNNSNHYCFNNYLLDENFNTFNDNKNINSKKTVININNEEKLLKNFINEKNFEEKLNIKKKLGTKLRNISSGNLNRTYIININNKNADIPKLHDKFKKLSKINIYNNYNNDVLSDLEIFEKIKPNNTPNKTINNLNQENLVNNGPKTTRNKTRFPITFYSKKNLDKSKTLIYNSSNNLKKNINNQNNLNQNSYKNITKNINPKKINHYKTLSIVGNDAKIQNYTKIKSNFYNNNLKIDRKNFKKSIPNNICYNTDNDLNLLNINKKIIEKKYSISNRRSKFKQYENSTISKTIENKNNIYNNFITANSYTNSDDNLLSPRIYKKPNSKKKLLDFVNENSIMRKSINIPANKIINISAKTYEIGNMLLPSSNQKILQYNRLGFLDNEYANKSQTGRYEFIIPNEATDNNNILYPIINNGQLLYEFSNFKINEKFQNYYSKNSFMSKMYCYAIKTPKISKCVFTKNNNYSNSMIRKPLIRNICYFSKKIKKLPRTPKFYNSFYKIKNIENKDSINSKYLSNIEKGLKILNNLFNQRVVQIYDLKKGIKKLISFCSKKQCDIKEDNSYLYDTNSSNFSFKTNLKFDNKLKNNFHEKMNLNIKKSKNSINNIQLNKIFKYKKTIENDSITDINTICNNFQCELMNLLNALTKNNFNKILINVEDNILLNKNNEILFNEKVQLLISIIFDKASKEICYSFLYAKLFNELNIKLFNEFLDKNNCKIDKDKNIKLLINDEYNNIFNDYKKLSEDSFVENKNKFFGFLFFIDELIKFELIKQQDCFHIFNQIYQKYISEISNKKKFIFLEAGLVLLNNIGKNIISKKNKKHIDILNEIITETLTNILKENKINKKIPNYLKYKIINIIEKHKNNWKNSLYEQSINFKNYHTNFYLYTIDINNENLLLISENKDTDEGKYNDDADNIIKNDLLKYLIYSIEYNPEKINNLIVTKSLNLAQIIIYYTKNCKELVNNEKYIKKANVYLTKLIENLHTNLTKQEIDFIRFEINKIFNDINKAIGNNRYMYKILGNLLFILISKGYYSSKNFNHLFKDKEKDENIETIINLAIITRYCIIFSGSLAKKYYNDFKQTKLFIINKGIFSDYVTGMLSDYLFYTK